MVIFVGGVREALFGDENYPVMWGKRHGYARTALQANVVRSTSHYTGISRKLALSVSTSTTFNIFCEFFSKISQLNQSNFENTHSIL